MYTDIHSHILYGTDDGPKTKNEMLSMLDVSYRDGVRDLCVTPHFNFDFYGDNTHASLFAFQELLEEASRRYPDMRIYRGNEIFYHNACIGYLKERICHTLNGTKYVLFDFASTEDKFKIIEAVKNLISCGYIPILAHTERYVSFGFSTSTVELIKEMGAVIQINAPSLIGKNGFRQKHLSNRLVAKNLCDVVSSDSHNVTDRISCMDMAYKHLEKRYGSSIAAALTCSNAKKILNNERI